MEGQKLESHGRDSREESLGRQFHFKEIAEIEPAVISLVEQLKEKIDRGEYDTLISDDVGGRIPTLILRKILQVRNPEKKLKTLFIAGGHYLPGPNYKKTEYQELQSYLRKVIEGTQKALLVTQFVFKGKTMARLSRALKSAGLKDFDVATVHVSFENEARQKIDPELGENKLYIGGQDHGSLHEKHEHLGGVRKIKKGKYSPHPQRAVDVTAEEGRELSDDEWNEVFDVRKGESYNERRKKETDPEKIKEFERRTHAPLTPEEKTLIQKNINEAREDVALMAERVMNKVWGQK